MPLGYKFMTFKVVRRALCGVALKFMEKYCLDNEIFGKYMNEKLMDITDMLLEAQENGVPVENVIGSDKKTYAENMFSDMSIGKVFGDMTYYLTFFAWMFLLIGAVQETEASVFILQPEST